MVADKNKYVYWTKFQKDTSPLLRRFLLAASGLFAIAASLHILPLLTQQGEVDFLFFAVDLSFSGILFLEYLLKNKVPLIIRVFSLITATVFLSVLSYVRSGLLGSAEISLTFMVVSFYIFLPPIVSLVSSIIISLLPALFGGIIYIGWLRFPDSLGIRNNNPREWIFNSISLILFSVLTGFLIQRLRSKLIKNIVYLKESRSKILKSQKHIDKLAFYDSLTHLPNRHLFDKLIQNRINSGISESLLLLINLKGLKVINALHGIEFGDQILTLTGCVLKLYTDEKPDILVASLGGDEFILWIENSTKSKIEEAIVNFDLNNNELLTPERLGHRLQYRVSGIQFPNDATNLDEMTRKLSIAMNVARDGILTKLVWFQAGMES